jgi:hypothetical protein
VIDLDVERPIVDLSAADERGLKPEGLIGN